MRHLILVVLSLLVVQAKANILSTIKPIDLIVKEIAGAELPSSTLLDQFVSPHHYVMKVSDAERLSQSDIVFWVGPSFETFLIKAIENREKDSVSLLAINTFQRAAPSASHEHHGREHHHHHAHESDDDAHIWLSYQNAIVIAAEITRVLSGNYPQYAARFSDRYDAFAGRMRLEEKQTREHFKRFQSRPFGVYHDGYNAYIKEFNLTQVAFVSRMPDAQLSLKKLMSLKRVLSESYCLLGEASDVHSLHRLAMRLDVKPVAIDLLGHNQSQESVEGGFSDYMDAIRNSFLECLSDV